MQNKMLQLKEKMEKMLSTQKDKPFWKYKTNLLVVKQYIEESKKQEENYELVHMWEEVKTKFSTRRKWSVPNEIRDFAYYVAEIYEKNEQYQKALETLDVLVFAQTGYNYDENMRHEELSENLINEVNSKLYLQIKKMDYKIGNITEEELGLEFEKIIDTYGPSGLEVNKKGISYIVAPEEFLKMFFDEKEKISEFFYVTEETEDLTGFNKRLSFYEKNFNQKAYSINRVWKGKEKFSGYIAFSINGMNLIILDKIFEQDSQGNKTYNIKEPTIIAEDEKIVEILTNKDKGILIEKDEKYYKTLIEKINFNLDLGKEFLDLLEDPQGNVLEKISYQQNKKRICRRKNEDENRQDIIQNIKKLIEERERKKKELQQVFFERGKWEEKRNQFLKVDM